MASDSTYLFFRRESDEAGGAPHAPVINTTRVVKRGGLRGASVPPIHLGARASRAGSVSAPRGFVRPTPVIHTVSSTSSSHVGGSRLSLAAPSTSSVSAVPFASLSGYQPRPVARRASIAAPGGSTLRIWSVGNTAPSSGSSSLTRGLTEVTKVGGVSVGGAGAGARSSIYRPSTQAGFGRSTAFIRVGGGQAQAGVGGRSAAAGGTGSSGRLSRSQVSLYPRGSVSGFGGSHWDADPRLDPLGKTQHRSAYVGGGGSGSGGGGGGGGGALYGCSGKDDRVVKHRLENGEEEMQACFTRLMHLVPTIPPNEKMTKVQLLQHVIDYILDLEMTLDFRPSESPLRHGSATSASVVAKDTDDVTSGGSDSRRPLSENASQVNNCSPDDVLQQALSMLPTTLSSSSSSSSSLRQPTTWS